MATKRTVRAHYTGPQTTSMILRNGKTATKRQYMAAMRRLHAIEGDYLVPADNGPSITVWNNDIDWASIG